MKRTLWPFVAAALVSGIARRMRALSPSGVIAATVVGGLTVAGAGIRGGTALGAFFFSSSLLHRLPPPRTAARPQRRGHERDAVQVLANGGTSALLAVAAAAAPPRMRALLVAGLGGAMAAATADTWATEIGSRSSRKPRSIASWQPVPSGTSGAVTWAGIAASAAGSAAIALVLSSGQPRKIRPRILWLATFVGGFAGAVADSFLGATLQDVRFCEACQEETELHRHQCGQSTRSVRGRPWCDNDAVNTLATLVGAAVAIGAAAVCSQSRDTSAR